MWNVDRESRGYCLIEQKLEKGLKRSDLPSLSTDEGAKVRMGKRFDQGVTSKGPPS